MIGDYEPRHLYDANYDVGYLVKQLNDDAAIHYIKTKKVAVVSSRD